MTGGRTLDNIRMTLRDVNNATVNVYIDVFDNPLSYKWLNALNELLEHDYMLEKNYCFFGFAAGARNGEYILAQVNRSIKHINDATLGYHIEDNFTMANTMSDDPDLGRACGRNINHDRLNRLHRYFEDLQGVSGSMSPFYQRANAATRWHIRQLNLLCHEFESWALSYRKAVEAPEWQRPSQLMCWLNAPRFTLDKDDYKLFGVDTLNRPLGGVFVGVNKAVGKHHWEVFNDEGRDSRINELTTTTLRSQTEAAGDFDIEWGRDPGEFEFQQKKLSEFRHWLIDNGFDPWDPCLTIGHPQVGQIDLLRSFSTDNYHDIWKLLTQYNDVFEIVTDKCSRTYPYRWNDADFEQNQIQRIQQGN